MSCGRIYGHLASAHRGLGLGLTLFAPNRSRVPNFLRDRPLQCRRFRSEFYRSETLFGRLRRGFQQHSSGISRACARQFEYVMAQRIRRAQQAGSFYLQLWGSSVLRGFLNRILSRLLSRMRLYIVQRTNATVLSASAVSFFSWSNERIPEEDLYRYSTELDAVACLRQRSPSKNSSSSPENGSNSIQNCSCHFHDDRLEDPWELFIKQENLLVWRREVPNHRGEGLYEYKVYGSYDDITAVDFLAVHVDTKFRKEWDASAVALEVLEEEIQTNSEVIYWEMQWPRMMSNRDYVYKRRYLVHEKENVIIIVNQNTEHQAAPVKPGKQRVTEYWSIIVIKPFTDMNKTGLQFSMTYFDNPGLVFPSAFASWATATGFPDYLNKLHQATRVFADRRLKEEAEEEARKVTEAAAKEEQRKKDEEDRRRRESSGDTKSSRVVHTPETWEVIVGGGPVLNSSSGNSNDKGESLNTLLRKIVLLVT